MTAPSERDPTPGRVAMAWGVHAFTASGAVVGAVALLAVASGEFRSAVLLMMVALSIDAIDGSLARRVGVERILPRLDGRRLDDMVDYLNYVLVPAVFLVATGALEHWIWASLPILASAYGFSQTSAKTEDDFFLGFPSYWNVIAIYVWLLAVPATAATFVIAVFAALVFVPLKYVYPSKLRVLRRTTLGLAAAWLLLLTYVVLNPGRPEQRALVHFSLLFPVYYFALSFRLGGVHRARD